MRHCVKSIPSVFFAFLLAGGAALGTQAAGLPLCSSGKTDYRIVLPENASENLRYAAHELKIHLEEASGAAFPVTEGTTGSGRQIVLREKDPSLKIGEFLIRTEGDKLLLSGGGESGIHHAVHDFLESDCGYIWYDARGGKRVPDLRNFKLPELDRRKSYPLFLRSMTPDYFFHRPEAHRFLYRNGMNLKIRLMPLPGMDKTAFHFENFQNEEILPVNGVNDLRQAAPAGHTLFDYIPDAPKKSRIKAFKTKGYFKEHPEWFSLDENGRRVVRQLCFSNPALRAEFKKNFYEHIRSTPSKNSFSVTAFDFPGEFCCCGECRAAVAKYKTKGAPIFLFVKELAEAAEKDFPQIKICTYAYRKEQTEVPPKGLTFPDNVILEFWPIDDDMSKAWDGRTNAETYRNLTEWRKCCRNVVLGYYVNPWTFGTMTVPPFGNVRRCAKDIALARKAGVSGCNFSHPVGVPGMTGFTELQSYLMARLMRDPGLDADPLIDDFMNFEYGPAAPLMKTYLSELEDVAAKTDVFVKWNATVGTWKPFLRSRDVVRWQGYFDRMEGLTAATPEINFSVRRVRIPLDLMTLRFFRRIKKEVPEYGSDVAELGTRIKSSFHQATAAFYPERVVQIKKHKANHDKTLDRMVDKLVIQEGGEPVALPPEIFGKIDPALIFEFFPEPMGSTEQIRDGGAAWGHTMFNDKEKQGFPIQILEADRSRRLWEIIAEIHVPKAGMEGKYCFYNIGETSITPGYEVRLLFERYRYLFHIFPGEVWMPGTDDTVTIYISLKLTGPKYYPGSKEKNSIACDRIVIVRKTND